MSYYSQQEEAHRWADDTFLSRSEAEELALFLMDYFNVPPVGWFMLWEQPALCWPSMAATVQNPRTGGLTVAFATRGCSLLILCHELAHVIRPWEDPSHDEIDWMLTALLLELARYEV